MSMSPYDGEDDDNEQDEINERLRADADTLTARWESSDMETKLRKLGCYTEQTTPVPVPHPSGPVMSLGVVLKVNRAAWTQRVLDPEADAMNRQFETMAVHAQDDEFLDQRAQILKNIAEGRDPMDNGDDDED